MKQNGILIFQPYLENISMVKEITKYVNKSLDKISTNLIFINEKFNFFIILLIKFTRGSLTIQINTFHVSPFLLRNPQALFNHLIYPSSIFEKARKFPF